MKLYIPLVCENVQDMSREEYLEVLSGIFAEYVHTALTEDRLYYRFGEGIIQDTSLEDWLEVDGPIRLFTGTDRDVNDFMELHDHDRMHVVANSRGHFAFTPGVVDEDGLKKFEKSFARIAHLHNLTDTTHRAPVAPCFTVTLTESPFSTSGKDLEDAVKDSLNSFIEATQNLDEDDFHVWMEQGYAVEFFLVDHATAFEDDTSPSLLTDGTEDFIVRYVGSLSDENQ